MGLTECLSDAAGYVTDGLIRRPITWILLAIFCIGNYLFSQGIEYEIYQFFYPALLKQQHFSSAMPQYGVALPILMIVAGFILDLFLKGYLTRVYRGDYPAPRVNDYKKLLTDGIKLWVIDYLYLLIPILILVPTVLIPALNSGSGQLQPSNVAYLLLTCIGGILLAVIAGVILTLFLIIGRIRFAKTGRVMAAFELSAILRTISEIGWVRYILSLILLFVVLMGCTLAFMIVIKVITVVAALLGHYSLETKMTVDLILFILVGIFYNSLTEVYTARYLNQVYERGVVTSPEEAETGVVSE